MREYNIVKYQNNLWALVVGRDFGLVLINKRGDIMQMCPEFSDELVLVDKKTVHPFLVKDFDKYVANI